MTGLLGPLVLCVSTWHRFRLRPYTTFETRLNRKRATTWNQLFYGVLTSTDCCRDRCDYEPGVEVKDLGSLALRFVLTPRRPSQSLDRCHPCRGRPGVDTARRQPFKGHDRLFDRSRSWRNSPVFSQYPCSVSYRSTKAQHDYSCRRRYSSNLVLCAATHPPSCA